jgi:PAS domain S-box-containing protein
MQNWKLPVYATLAYVLAGSSWILIGHFLSSSLYPNDAASLFELAKGLVFVGITASVLFIALTYLDRRHADNMIAGDLGEEFNRSLRHGDFVARWLPALVITLYCAIFLIIAAALWWVREHTLQGGEKSALALQKAQAAQMSSSLDIINFTLRDIARDIADNRQALTPEQLRSYIPDIASSVANIGYTDASGKVIAHTNPGAVNLDFASRSYFKFHRDNPDSSFHLSEPFIGTAVARTLIIASRPIRTTSGKFSGAVTAVIDPAIFGAYWRQSSDSDTTISVYDSNDKLLLRSPYLETAIGHADWQPLSALSEVKEGNSKAFRASSPIDGVDRVYGAGAIPGYPKLRLIVGLNQSQLLESWFAFAVTSLTIYLLVASGLAALTFTLLRQLRERLILQRKAAELARYPLQNRNPVLTVTPSGKKLFLNNAARQLLQAVKGKPAEVLEQELVAIAVEKKPGLREFAIGTHIWSASFVPHPPDFCDIYLTDVTTARQGENLLQLFFELPFLGMAITSPESKQWGRFNDQLCHILGYSRNQLMGKTWAELPHPDDLNADVTEFDRTMRDESDGYSMDKRFIRADGTVIYAVIDVHAVRRADRSVECFLATIQDITERKMAEAALRESEQKFKALVEQSLIGIYIVDNEKLIYVNPRAAEIFGYEPEELSEVGLAQVIAPEDRELVRENIRKRTSGDVETLRYEFRGIRKDGQIIEIGVHGSRTMLNNRPVVLGVLQDITDRRAQEVLVKGYIHRLERSIMSTVQAISHMVDLRDPYTSGHERRVGELAAAIGAELGLTEHQVTGLRVAGGVHDVGKIAVPAEILSKPTRLSAAEFAIVKTHAQQGYEILKDIEFPWPIANAVWQHHERLDGSGYPLGLRGDEISLEARILAVADVVESMSTHRPYRPALGLDPAFAELESKSGALYDPSVVAACIRLFREKGFQLPA